MCVKQTESVEVKVASQQWLKDCVRDVLIRRRLPSDERLECD